MKKILFSFIALAMITVGCNNKQDTTLCKEHDKNCPISENCPEHPECEAHENCEKRKDCSHKACMVHDTDKTL